MMRLFKPNRLSAAPPHAIRLPVCAAVLWLLLCLPPSISAQPEEVRINNPSAYGAKQRPAVLFNHDAHMGNHECLDCHHDYQNGQNVLDEAELEEDGRHACIQCHSAAASIDLKTAFHRQCIGCHRRSIHATQGPSPVSCAGCHPK